MAHPKWLTERLTHLRGLLEHHWVKVSVDRSKRLPHRNLDWRARIQIRRCHLVAEPLIAHLGNVWLAIFGKRTLLIEALEWLKRLLD